MKKHLIVVLSLIFITSGFSEALAQDALNLWLDDNSHLWVENSFYKWDITHGSSLVNKTGNEWRDWRIPGYESYRLELGRGGGGGQPYDRLFMSDLNFDNMINNGQTAVAELSGTFAGLQPFTITIEFYSNSGLIKMDYTVGNVTNDPNPPSIFHRFSFVPGGDVSNNDYYHYSGQNGESGFPYNSWARIYRSSFQTVETTDYVYITDYDKNVNQGFAMISGIEQTADFITDINYGIAQILDYHPYGGYSSMSIHANAVESPTVYWFFYETDPITAYQPVEDLINGWGLGSICVSADIEGNPIQGVTVTVLDQNNDPVGDPIATDENGEAYFDSITVGQYSVMVVTPLGYSVSPAETQTNVSVFSGDCAPVDFVLTPTVITNDSRSIGYWKHQFNVYTSGRGNAQESYADLETCLNLVQQHFSVLGVYVDIENFNLEDAKNTLTVRGGSLMLDRAKQQLFALLLNLASGKIGQETVVSYDGRVSAEAVTYVSTLINDGNAENDELAKNICDLINKGQLVEAGVIQESPVRYKFVPDVEPGMLYSVQNYPNPFNAQTTINFALPKASFVTVEVYDLLGRSVSVLVDSELPAGYHSVIWDAGDQSSGMYFYKIQAGEFIETRKMLILK
jgi:hypothetical protein